MKLHVFSSTPALQRPGGFPLDIFADFLDEPIAPARAFWLSPRCGRYNHDFLTDKRGDNRLEIFARSLRENFGTRIAPYIVLTDLDAAGCEVITTLAQTDACDAIHIHFLTLAPEFDPDPSAPGLNLSELDSALKVEISIPIEIRRVWLLPGDTCFDVAFQNAVAAAVAARVAGKRWRGFAIASDVAEGAAFQLLQDAQDAGLTMPPPLCEADLASLAQRVVHHLEQRLELITSGVQK